MSEANKIDEEELEDEDQEEYEDEEEEEEEFDPEEKFQEEPKPTSGDLKSLSAKEREVYEKNNKRVLFLKALAMDCYQDTSALAKKVGLNKSEAESIISVFLHLLDLTREDLDYPERILNYFNKLVPNNYPNKHSLEAANVNELTNIVRVMDEKLKNMAKTTNPDKIFGPGIITDTKSINHVDNQKENVVMTDSQQVQSPFQQPPPNIPTIPIIPQQEEPRGPPKQDMSYYAGKYPVPDIGLMEMALKIIPNPRPNSISQFITSFTDLYLDWMHNPHKMLDELKFFFGPTHGEHAFRLWRDYRDRYMKETGYNPMPNPGEYSSYNFTGYNSAPMMQPMQLSPEQEMERAFERRMNKTMQMMQLRMMETAMQNQMPSAGQQGQSYEEFYDQNGRVVKRVILPTSVNGHAQQQQNPLEGTLITTLSQMFQEVIRGINNEKTELYRKLNTPDNTLSEFAKTMMSNYLTQSNPSQQVKEMLELTNMVKTQVAPQQENAQKSIEAIKMDIDSKIALQELELKKMEMQHNWRMDENQQVEQDQNVDKWLNVMLQMGEGIIKPVAMKFVEGLGSGAGKIPNPLGGLFGGGQQQGQPSPQQTMQMPPSPQQQAYQAQMERDAYMNQPPPQQHRVNPNMQQQRIPPMQPIPPMQRPPMQQQNMQKPVSQLSEQDLEGELSRLTPQQIQEIEDKMALDEINRERIKHAIQAFKNAGRLRQGQGQRSQQQLSAQQQEAQNVLFNPPTPEELEEPRSPLEEDDFDELDEEEEDEEFEGGESEEERFVPIARGDGKEPVSKEGKKISYKEFMPESTTETVQRKKLSPQQKAMLAEGQLSPRELAKAPDLAYDEFQEEDDYSTGGVPLPAGIRNASDDEKVEENLKKTRQEPAKKAKKSKKQEPVETENIVEEAQQILDEAELIPSDDVE